MVNSVGAESEAATVWPRSIWRCTTTPSTGERISVRARSISMSRSLASRCRITASAGLQLRLGERDVGVEPDRARPGAEAICASEEASVAFWTSVWRARRVERRLRADAARDELGLPVEVAPRVGELRAATRSRCASEVLHRRLGALPGRLRARRSGRARMARSARRLLEIGAGGVAPRLDLRRDRAGRRPGRPSPGCCSRRGSRRSGPRAASRPARSSPG